MNENQLYELIERMTAVKEAKSSRESISWKAHREAEKLDDASLFPILMKIIDSNKSSKGRKIREAAYFILGKLLKKRFEREPCKFMIARLTDETNKYTLSSMLDLLANIQIPEDIDIEPIVLCAKSDKWLIRHSAINALGASAARVSREMLSYYLDQDDEKQYKYEIIYANASLGKIGDKADIALLEKHLHSRIRDIKISAQIAIERIKSKSEE